MNSEILERLKSESDEKYADFTAKLIPTVSRNAVLGVRLPTLRKIAKELARKSEYREFLTEKHYFLEEKLLHGFLLGCVDFSADELIKEIERFLPQIDNWSVCDSTVSALKSVKNNRGIFYEKIREWLKSDKTYTIRFALVLLLDYYLDDGFDARIFDELLQIETDEYYVNMALAWYFSFALIKRYDETIGLFENGKIKNETVFNKSIQKAKESYRISDDKKKYLTELKNRNKRT